MQYLDKLVLFSIDFLICSWVACKSSELFTRVASLSVVLWYLVFEGWWLVLLSITRGHPSRATGWWLVGYRYRDLLLELAFDLRLLLCCLGFALLSWERQPEIQVFQFWNLFYLVNSL